MCACVCAIWKCDCMPTPSCCSFIHTGVVLSRKACIRFLDIVKAGAMNYLPVHVFVKAFFFPVIFYLFASSVLHLSSLEAGSWLIQTVTWHQKSITFLGGGQVSEAGGLGGRTIVTAAHVVEEFAEVYQLIHNWSLLVYDNISQKREVKLPQFS